MDRKNEMGKGFKRKEIIMKNMKSRTGKKSIEIWMGT
jgi:hypothetical protein